MKLLLRSGAAAVIAVACVACDDPRAPGSRELETTRVAPADIHNGTSVDTCAFPTIALLGSSTCTATLIHPEILVYAAHCGTGFSSAHFGESTASGFDRAIASCTLHPDYSEPDAEWDYAMCRLAEPLDGMPIVPPIMGCETDVLVAGRPVVVVGFGWETEGGGGAGVKRQMPGVVSSIMFSGTSIAIDGVDENAGACPGDSGGPTFVELDDGSFRQLGVHHTGSANCNFAFGVNDKRLWMGVPWIESATGLDVTPCHDADGTWNPGPGCTGFPTDPEAGVGDWPACGAGPMSGLGQTCGPAFGSGSGGSGSGGGDAGSTASAAGTGGASGEGGAAEGAGGSASAGGGDAPSPTTGAQTSNGSTTSGDGDGATVGAGGAGSDDADSDDDGSDDGCGCRAAGAVPSRAHGSLAGAAVLGAAFASRRRRRAGGARDIHRGP